jgi:predicted GIY-YIG superfamily endonuclease
MFRSQSEALARERQLKRWTSAKKQALIEGDLNQLKSLSKRHT